MCMHVFRILLILEMCILETPISVMFSLEIYFDMALLATAIVSINWYTQQVYLSSYYYLYVHACFQNLIDFGNVHFRNNHSRK